ncbi:MAG: bifunctional diaminohydroxyphosphoribosylaminopyrimidine deaminase/5-amino-6-(5-phosphoribosylamino)uracil reductase RibD [Rhodospirillales bacterium]
MRSDLDWMQAALALARRGLGRTWPNPTVGCVLVRDGRLLAGGFTQPGGRPHAEADALAHAGNAKGATAYVTLEPCSHHGRTPPCADALIEAGISRVVVATGDPNPEVNGQGLARLRAAGIEIQTGVGEVEAKAVNAGFFLKMEHQRPWVTLKLATSLDGKLALHNGESRWITGEAARAHGHMLRATHDAIAVGIGTVLADDPELTCRLPGLEDRSPLRVVFDGQGRTPDAAKLLMAPPRTIIVTETAIVPQFATRLIGIDVHGVARTNGQLDLRDALRILAGLGITRLLVEGGAAIAAAFLRADLVDRIAWYRAPIVIGDDGKSGVAALDLRNLAKGGFFSRTAMQTLGSDVMETFERKP